MTRTDNSSVRTKPPASAMVIIWIMPVSFSPASTFRYVSQIKTAPMTRIRAQTGVAEKVLSTTG